MSFKVKSPKTTPPPDAPTQPLAPVSTPQSDRVRRLSSGGRQSTFLGRAARAALAAPGNTLTGVSGAAGGTGG